MRESHYNQLDNLSRRLEHQIEKRIREMIQTKNDPEDRSPKKARDGITRFGAFQLFNPHNAEFVTMGANPGGAVVVGP